MLCFVTPIQSDHVAWKFFDQFRVMKNDVAPKHHLLSSFLDLAMKLQKEIEINPAFAQAFTKFFALAAAQVPGLVTADVEKIAGKVRQKFIEKFANKLDRAGIVWSERGRITKKIARRANVRFADFGKFFERRILKPVTQMAEGILV